ISTVSAGGNNPTIMGSSWSNGTILRGFDAIRNNPANLGLSDNVQGSLNVFFFMPNLSYVLENSFSLNVYNDYISKSGDNSWSSSDVDKILDQLDDKWRIQNELNFDIFGLTYHNMGFSIAANSIQNISVPKELLELVLKGNETGKVYDAKEFDGESFSSVSLDLSYAHTINHRWIDKYFQEFSVGGTIRLIHSLPGAEMDDFEKDSEEKISPAYFKIKNVDSYIVAHDITDENSPDEGATQVKGSFEVLVSEAGMGFATDLAMAGIINDKMTIGLSFIDLFSYIDWYKNSKIYKYEYKMNGLLLSDMDDSDDSLFADIQTTKDGSFYTTLPIELKLDYVWKFYPENQNLFWTSAYKQGFKNELTSTTMPKFSTGFEWYHNSAKWFRFRSGITLGGDALYSSAAGFSTAFKHYSMDFAIENKYFYGDSSKGLSFAIGQKIYW
ncbi:MAG: hypothetical protein L6407_05055, partial [Candidatus Delongbacteria bacterium]|nr:hypothetical protein [Candidatus Delongbacteria bacterium]